MSKSANMLILHEIFCAVMVMHAIFRDVIQYLKNTFFAH
jgi:hypothetical protein